jgi:hypothetical protein
MGQFVTLSEHRMTGYIPFLAGNEKPRENSPEAKVLYNCLMFA